MKKLIALCLSLVMAFGLVACGENKENNDNVSSQNNSENVQTENTPEIVPEKIEDPETAPNLSEELVYFVKENDSVFYDPFFTPETYIKLSENVYSNLDDVRQALEKGDLDAALTLAMNEDWAKSLLAFAQEKIPFEEGTVFNFWTVHNGEIVRFGLNKRAPLGKDDYSILQIDWRSENGKAFWMLMGISIYGVDVKEVRIGMGNTKDYLLNGEFSMIAAQGTDLENFSYKFSGNAVNDFADGTITEEFGPESYWGSTIVKIEMENGVYKSCDHDVLSGSLEFRTDPQRPYDLFREY